MLRGILRAAAILPDCSSCNCMIHAMVMHLRAPLVVAVWRKHEEAMFRVLLPACIEHRDQVVDEAADLKTAMCEAMFANRNDVISLVCIPASAVLGLSFTIAYGYCCACQGAMRLQLSLVHVHIIHRDCQ